MITNRQIWEAFPALLALGNEKLPTALAWRVALNRNHLVTAFETLDQARQALVAAFDVAPEKTATPGYPERYQAFEREWRALLDNQVDWTSPAPIDARKFFAVREVVPNMVAPLVAAGIITDSEALLDAAAPPPAQGG